MAPILSAAGRPDILGQPNDAPATKISETEFVDRFASLNTDRWRVHDRVSHGAWTENDWRPSQVDLIPEGVRLSLERGVPGGTSRYTSGEISSNHFRASGYVEARMKVARGSGTNTGMFMFGQPSGVQSRNEIDIEILGRNTSQAEFTIHVGRQTVSKVHQLGFDASASFNTYGMEWRKGLVRWYVNNKMVHEVRGGLADRLTREQGLHLNLWGTSVLVDWMGRLDPARRIWSAEVSCAAMADRYEGKPLCAPAPAPARVAPIVTRTPQPAKPTLAPTPVPAVPVPAPKPAAVTPAPASEPAPKPIDLVPAQKPAAAPVVSSKPAEAAPAARHAVSPLVPLAAPEPLPRPLPVPAPSADPSPADDEEELAGAPRRQ